MRCNQLKIADFVKISLGNREILVSIDKDALDSASKLDGCHVIKTDLKKGVAPKEVVHAGSMRPLHVRLESRTRGHAFVVMLAYQIVQELPGIGVILI